MLLFNLPPKLLFFFAMAMPLARKSTQKMPNVTKTHAKNDLFKLAHELLDNASKIENGELEIEWLKKQAFGILCDANFAKFELKMDENVGKLRNNLCELVRNNDFSNENLLKIFVNDKEAWEDLIGFVSTDKQPIIDTKIIFEKIKNSPILSNENGQNLATMFLHLNAGTAIITKIIKSNSFTTATTTLIGTNRRRKRMDNNNNNQNNNNNGYNNVYEMLRQAQLIHGRRRVANDQPTRDDCFFVVIILIFWAYFLLPDLLRIGSWFIWVFLSISFLLVVRYSLIPCRNVLFSNSEPLLPL